MRFKNFKSRMPSSNLCEKVLGAQVYGRMFWTVVSFSFIMTALSGCTIPKYAARDSGGTRVLDSALRYGGIAAAGAGAGAGAYMITKNPAAAAGAGVAAAGVMYAFEKFNDSKKQSAYNTGVEDGANAVRAEIADNIWQRDAVYGDGKGGAARSSNKQQTLRRVYVPSRVVNGVVLQGGYQEIPFYR